MDGKIKYMPSMLMKGRADWKFTQPFVKKQCADAGLDLVIVKADDDLLTIIFKRWLKIIRDGKKVPHFPSAAARYCTKASKTQPTDKYLRRHNLVINVMGIRAQESRTRAKKPVVSLRTSLCSEKFAVKFCELDTKKVKKYWLPVEEAWRLWNETDRKHRLAIDWNAIHSWNGSSPLTKNYKLCCERVGDSAASAVTGYKLRKLPTNLTLFVGGESVE